jgi:hypothetical protein
MAHPRRRDADQETRLNLMVKAPAAPVPRAPLPLARRRYVLAFRTMTVTLAPTDSPVEEGQVRPVRRAVKQRRVGRSADRAAIRPAP